MDELMKLAVTSPSAALGLVLFALAVVGAGALLFLRSLRDDLNGIGGKLNGIINERTGDKRDFAHLKEGHEKLAESFAEHKETLPDRLTKDRHDYADRVLNPLILGITADISDLKGEIRDLKRGAQK